MIKKTVSFATVFVLGCAVFGSAAQAPQISTDVIPQSSRVTDLLSWLSVTKAVNGPLSHMDFSLNRHFTRMEAAAILADAISRYGAGGDAAEQMVFQKLIHEFSAELKLMGVEKQDLDHKGKTTNRPFFITNEWLYGDLAWKDTKPDSIGAGSLSVIGLTPDLTVGLTVSNRARLDDPSGRRYYPLFERFEVAGEHFGWRWDIGRTANWLGTAEGGSIFLGDSSPAITQARTERVYHLGRAVGPVLLSWQVGGYKEKGKTYHIISRRATKTFSRQWTFSILDIVKTRETPNPLNILLPGPLYQSFYLKDVDREWNGILGLEAVYRSGDKLDAYGQLLIDDISNPFDPNRNVPNKTGYLLGMRLRSGSLNDAHWRLCAEYSVINSGTYSATRPEYPLMAWFRSGGLPLGWPYGPNSKTFMLKGDAKLNNGLGLNAAFVNSDVKAGSGNTRSVSFKPTLDMKSNSITVGVSWDRSWGLIDEERVGVFGYIGF